MKLALWSRAVLFTVAAVCLVWFFTSSPQDATYSPATAPGVEPAPYNAEGGAP